MILIKHDKKGFTLVEIMISFLILILLSGVILEIFKNSINAGNVFSINLDSQREIRKSFNSMVAGIRSASQSNLGSYPIDSAATSSFIYYSDIDGDNLRERVRYFLDDDSLKQGILKPSGSPLSYNLADEDVSFLVENVAATSTPVFQYYDGNYDGDSAPLSYPINITDIRLIKITILINQNMSDTPSSYMEFTTQVSIRNLKDNL